MPTIVAAPTSMARPRSRELRLVMRPLLRPALATLLILFAGAWQEWTLGIPDRASVVALAAALASVATTFIGFILAALAVVASVAHTSLVQRMRTTGHYDDLLRTMFWAGAWFLAIDVGTFALLFGVNASDKVMLLLLGAHVGALFILLDVGHKLRLVLTNL